MKTLAGRLISKAYRHLKPNGPTSWDHCRALTQVASSAVIDRSAYIKIFSQPASPQPMVSIGEGSHIFSTFSLLRPESTIKVGARCQLGASQLIAADSIEIGDDVIMAWGITIIDTDNHSIFWEERKNDVTSCRNDYLATKGENLALNFDWSNVGIKKVTIGNKAWLGFNVIVLKGVTIGEGAVIGAGSVVTRDIKPWHVAAGNPCREIRAIPQRA